ncbi:MAG: exopolysaccharide biosynthesis protein [Acidobacteria bacterium]|nr:exopolysaccharide biosynthesis protein [Acidobacteriota bacterium]
MIDIHSHIIYGVDDGSKDLETSLEMLRLAWEHGTTDIVATPHANGEFTYDPYLNKGRVEQLRAHCGEIQIHTGCDFHLSLENVEDAFQNPAKYTINGHQYLLVEFPDGTLIPNIDSVFEQFLRMRVIPIITHPERNWVIQSNRPKFDAWVELGALVQVTGGSLTGRFGKNAKKFAEDLLNDGLCHFIASDAHDTRDRHPKLRNAHDIVTQKWGEETAETLFTANGRAVIAGEPLPSNGRHQPARKKKRWFFF